MSSRLQGRTLDLDSLVLQRGNHSPDSQFCVMEAVAYLAGEPWSDNPKCASHIISVFLRMWNDTADDEERQDLKHYVPLVIGTNTGAEDERRRLWLCVDWLVRKFAPIWLDKAGLGEHAAKLRALPDAETAEAAEAAWAAWIAGTAETAEAAEAAEAARAAWIAGAAWIAEAARAAGAAWAAWIAWAAIYNSMCLIALRAGPKRSDMDAALAPTVREMRASGYELLDAMIAVGRHQGLPGTTRQA